MTVKQTGGARGFVCVVVGGTLWSRLSAESGGRLECVCVCVMEQLTEGVRD